MTKSRVWAGCSAVLLGALLALAGCAATPPPPRPTPHYTIVPLVRPGQLRVEGSGASICATNDSAHDVVMGFGVENDDSAPMTLTGVSFSIKLGGRLAGAWTLVPPADLRTPAGLVTSEFDYPPCIESWNTRARLAGTVLEPGAQTYLLLRFVRDPGTGTALFLDPAIHYTKNGLSFTAQTTNTGYEYEPSGKCAFEDD